MSQISSRSSFLSDILSQLDVTFFAKIPLLIFLNQLINRIKDVQWQVDFSRPSKRFSVFSSAGPDMRQVSTSAGLVAYVVI